MFLKMLGFRVQGSGFRVKGPLKLYKGKHRMSQGPTEKGAFHPFSQPVVVGFAGWGLGFRVERLGFRVER